MTASGRVTQERWVRASCHRENKCPGHEQDLSLGAFLQGSCATVWSQSPAPCAHHILGWDMLPAGDSAAKSNRGVWVRITSRPGKKVRTGAMKGKNEEGLVEVWKAMNVVEWWERHIPTVLKPCIGLRIPACSQAPWGHGADQFILNKKTESDKNFAPSGQKATFYFMSYFPWCCIFRTHTGKCAWISIQTICTLK